MTKESRLLVNLKFILLLFLLENVATTPVVNLPKTAAASKKNDTACKFLFHVKGNEENGQFYVTGITMPPLEQMMKQADNSNNKNKFLTSSNIGANCIPQFMVQQNNEKLTKSKTTTHIKVNKKHKGRQKPPTWSILQKNSEEDSSEEDADEILINDSQPVYEQQEVVYPLEEEQIVDITSTSIPTSTTTTTARTPASTTTTSRTTTPLEKMEEKTGVKVEENYRYYQPDGTGEYKLMLSNGMTDYKRIYKKKVGGKEIIAQSGYYTVPNMDNKSGFQIQYYVADENGQRVYTDN